MAILLDQDPIRARNFPIGRNLHTCSRVIPKLLKMYSEKYVDKHAYAQLVSYLSIWYHHEKLIIFELLVGVRNLSNPHLMAYSLCEQLLTWPFYETHHTHTKLLEINPYKFFPLNAMRSIMILSDQSKSSKFPSDPLSLHLDLTFMFSSLNEFLRHSPSRYLLYR